MAKHLLWFLMILGSFASQAYADKGPGFGSRPTAPGNFAAVAISPTVAELTWKAGDSNISGYVLLIFRDAASWTSPFPKSCRLHVRDGRDPNNHEDDDEAEAEDPLFFPVITEVNLGAVTSYQVTGLAPGETVVFRLAAVSASFPRLVSPGVQASLRLPAAPFALVPPVRYTQVTDPTVSWSTAAQSALYNLTVASDGPSCKKPRSEFQRPKDDLAKAAPFVRWYLLPLPRG